MLLHVVKPLMEMAVGINPNVKNKCLQVINGLVTDACSAQVVCNASVPFVSFTLFRASYTQLIHW